MLDENLKAKVNVLPIEFFIECFFIETKSLAWNNKKASHFWKIFIYFF